MIKYKLHKLFAIIYFTAMLLSAAHFHHDLRVHHSDCKVCSLSQNLSGGDVCTDLSPLALVFFAFEPIAFTQKIILIPVLKGFYAQAPPVLL